MLNEKLLSVSQGYTTISSTLPPRKVANLLDRLYNKFDDLSSKHDVFKVEVRILIFIISSAVVNGLCCEPCGFIVVNRIILTRPCSFVAFHPDNW